MRISIVPVGARLISILQVRVHELELAVEEGEGSM
jgi:hypothetical protein